MPSPRLDELFSTRSKQMKASEIRELLKLTNKPDVISFAGGLPNPESFPSDKIGQIAKELSDRDGSRIFQYGSTEGVVSLREHILARMKRNTGLNVGLDNILITSGSQQALDLVSKVFINGGDHILVGSPTYLGALQAFRSYKASFAAVDLDENGEDTRMVEETVKRMKHEGKKYKFIYTVATFQNPSGVTLSLERRKHLLELAQQHDFIIVEDDPYGELRFEGTPVPTIKSMDATGHVVYLGSLSKVMAPGFRVAFCIGNPDIISKMVIAKQAVDLCSNTFAQHVASEFLERGYLDPQVEKIKALYGRKRNVMLKALDEHAVEGMTWTKPQGGMFLWATVPGHIDTQQMFQRAVEQNVAYVHGACFYADRHVKNAMRLNFSHPADDRIVEGIKRLCGVVRSELGRK